MDRIAEWRPVEPAGPEGAAEEPPPTNDPAGLPGLYLIGIGLVAIALAIGGGILLLLSGGTRTQPAEAGGVAIVGRATDAPTEPAPTPVAVIVVDVQGAVERPGPQRLDAGSRIGDAIVAAGGYSARVDIAAAAQHLNLAALLSDGQQVVVPLRGEPALPAATPGAPAAGGAKGAGSLIDINRASQVQLETLPGIGPVTAAKIIAAREEAPFTNVDELLARKVVGPATMERVRPLVTAEP